VLKVAFRNADESTTGPRLTHGIPRERRGFPCIDTPAERVDRTNKCSSNALEFNPPRSIRKANVEEITRCEMPQLEQDFPSPPSFECGR
jgi:hypothetical protein